MNTSAKLHRMREILGDLHPAMQSDLRELDDLILEIIREDLPALQEYRHIVLELGDVLKRMKGE